MHSLRNVAVVVFCLLLTLAAGCGAGKPESAGLQAKPAEQSTSPFAALPGPASLPQKPHAAAFKLALELPAAESYQRSAIWQEAPDGSLSVPGSADWSWALYRFSVVTEIDDLMLLSLLGESIDAGGPPIFTDTFDAADQKIYVGLVDSSRTRWIWQPLATSQLPAALPFASGSTNTGPGGDWLYVAVVFPPQAHGYRLDSARLDINTTVPPPQGLSASFGSNADGIQLEWTDFSYYTAIDPGFSADTVSIERSSNGGASFSEIASLAVTEVSYLDVNAPDGLLRDRSYVYRIRYKDGVAGGNYSAKARGKRGTYAAPRVVSTFKPEGEFMRVKLDAAGSFVEGANTKIATYQWDLDDNGEYEFQGSLPFVSQIMNLPPEGQPYRLRLIDEYGLATEYASLIPFVEQSDFFITDDDGLPDPGENGTLSGETGSYQLDFYYKITFGMRPTRSTLILTGAGPSTTARPEESLSLPKWKPPQVPTRPSTSRSLPPCLMANTIWLPALLTAGLWRMVALRHLSTSGRRRWS